MTRIEKVIDLFNKYLDNYGIFSKLNDELLVDCDSEKWHQLLYERSVTQRNIIAENEQILDMVAELMQEPIQNKEEADKLLLFYRPVVNLKLKDYRMLELIYEPLQTFYEETKDYLRMIGLNVTAGSTIANIFGEVDREAATLDALKCTRLAIECSKKVSPTEDLGAWLSVFSAYANMTGSLPPYYPELRDQFFEYYDEAMSYFEDPKIGSLIAQHKNGPMFKALVSGRYIFLVRFYDELSEKTKNRLCEIIRSEQKNPTLDYSEAEKMTLKYYLSYVIGDMDARSAFLGLKNYFLCSSASIDTNLGENRILAESFENLYFTVYYQLELLRDKEFSIEERSKEASQIANKTSKIVRAIPYEYLTSYVNGACAAMCEMLIPHFTDTSDMQKVIMDMLILRQPITYIHSLMVKEIAVHIANELLEYDSSQFIPLFGQTKDEVLANKDAVLSFISNAALLHDIGKCKVADIINSQYRHICKEEFRIIEYHSTFGPLILNMKENFKPFYDVMMGHHKSYDGKSGYPIEFDNVASPYRIVIDIIKIADCIDASTDGLGRNYAVCKNFQTVLAELSTGKGTLYNPMIITMFEHSHTLYEKINKLTTTGRKHIYYMAYRDVMNLS